MSECGHFSSIIIQVSNVSKNFFFECIKYVCKYCIVGITTGSYFLYVFNLLILIQIFSDFFFLIHEQNAVKVFKRYYKICANP